MLSVKSYHQTQRHVDFLLCFLQNFLRLHFKLGYGQFCVHFGVSYSLCLIHFTPYDFQLNYGFLNCF